MAKAGIIMTIKNGDKFCKDQSGTIRMVSAPSIWTKPGWWFACIGTLSLCVLFVVMAIYPTEFGCNKPIAAGWSIDRCSVSIMPIAAVYVVSTVALCIAYRRKVLARRTNPYILV